MIARGQGLSYAAASFGAAGAAIDMRGFDRILDYDTASGDVVVEAGITLAGLFDFLASKHRYLVVQPGHGQISVGGCIAANVHGKNQSRDGTFYKQVQEVMLFHPRHGAIAVSRQSSPEVFDATCGGFGLTGIILRARLKTAALPSRHMILSIYPAATPEVAADMMRDAASSAEAVYSWHDFIAGKGDGLVALARFDSDQEIRGATRRQKPISAEWRARGLLSSRTSLAGRLINVAYRAFNRPGDYNIAVEKAIFPSQGSEEYFRLYGKRGFHEYQAIVPRQSFGEYVSRVRALAKGCSVPILLASAKYFEGQSFLLRFTGDGICFAINVPRSDESEGFLIELDRIAVELMCRPNIMKDSRLPRAIVEKVYPEYEIFKRFLRWCGIPSVLESATNIAID